MPASITFSFQEGPLLLGGSAQTAPHLGRVVNTSTSAKPKACAATAVRCASCLAKLLGPPSIPDRGPSPHERDLDRYPEVRELRSIDPVWHSSCRQPGINAADKPLPEGSGGPIDPARQPKLRTFRQNARPQRVSPSFTARGRDGMLPGTWVPPFDSGGLLAAGRPSHAEHAGPSPLRKRCTWRPRSAVGRTSHWRLRRADECCKPQNISNLLDTSSGDWEMAAPAEPHNLSCSRARRPVTRMAAAAAAAAALSGGAGFWHNSLTLTA